MITSFYGLASTDTVEAANLRIAFWKAVALLAPQKLDAANRRRLGRIVIGMTEFSSDHTDEIAAKAAEEWQASRPA